MINLKNNKGAITLYILICVLFFVIAIVNIHTNLKSKEARVESEYQKIKASYERDYDEEYYNAFITIKRLKETGKKVKRTVKLEDDNGDEIVIPKGFGVTSDSSILIEEGVVVVAPDKSEFIWVPVENINNMVMCQGSTGGDNCNIIKSGDKLVCDTHSGYNLCGKLYSTNYLNNFKWNLTNQLYSDSDLKEPTPLTSSIQGDYTSGDNTMGIELIKSIIGLTGTDEEIKNKWAEELQNEFNEMALSVFNNGGFYIGRYETSLNSNYESQSMKNKIPLSGITLINGKQTTWYGLYQKQKDYEVEKNLSSIIGSTMIWGCQYDQMMIWIQGNPEITGVDVTSIESDKLKGATKNMSASITGNHKEDVLNNVYDLLGGKMEWTIEAFRNNCRIARGGTVDNDYSPSHRDIIYIYKPNDSGNTSSRISLYVK